MTIHFFEFGEWSENSLGISKLIMSPSYRKYAKGDIYFRFNGLKVNCKQFTGETNSFYDQNFGAGEEIHRAVPIDINDFTIWLYHNSYELYVKVIKKLIERGFETWVVAPGKISEQSKENYNIV